MEEKKHAIILLIRGMPGSGKTKIALHIKKFFSDDCVVLDPDTLDKNDPDFNALRTELQGTISEDVIPYRYLLKKANEAVGRGKVVIWPQAWTKLWGIKSALRSLTEKNPELKRIVVEIELPIEIIKKRIAERVKTGGRGLDQRSLADFLEAFEPWDKTQFPDIEYCKIDGLTPSEHLANEILDKIKHSQEHSSPTPSVQYIFLLRHLKTQANENNLIMGRAIDPPVLPQTIKAFSAYMRVLRKKFPVLMDAQFFSSPTLRCTQTLEYAMKEINGTTQPYHTDERLNETDLGKFAGLTTKQIREQYPDLIDTWMRHPEHMTFPEGESYVDVSQRAWEWFTSVLTLPKNAIVAVTHVDIIKMILFKNLEIPIANKRLISVDTGSVTIFRKRGPEVVLIGTNLSSGYSESF